MNREQYMEYLCSRIFESNGFGSVAALIEAIEKANAIPAESQWRPRKDAFNKISEMAPMIDDGYCLEYENVPAFIKAETDAFMSVLGEKIGPVSVPVKYWDAYHDDGTVNTHQFDIEDQRKTNGQAYITVGALEGDIDDMLSVTMEVNRNPLGLSDEYVPAAHIHFNNSNLAFTVFKIGNKILMRPETDVAILPITKTIKGIQERVFWIE